MEYNQSVFKQTSNDLHFFLVNGNVFSMRKKLPLFLIMNYEKELIKTGITNLG